MYLQRNLLIFLEIRDIFEQWNTNKIRFELISRESLSKTQYFYDNSWRWFETKVIFLLSYWKIKQWIQVQDATKWLDNCRKSKQIKVCFLFKTLNSENSSIAVFSFFLISVYVEYKIFINKSIDRNWSSNDMRHENQCYSVFIEFWSIYSISLLEIQCHCSFDDASIFLDSKWSNLVWTIPGYDYTF